MLPGWGGLGGFGGGYHPHQGGGLLGAGFPAMRRFEEQYHCYSVAYADKAHLEKGDKILLPPSAFDILARLQVDYPMLFRLSSPDSDRETHCGVLEFTAEEGCVYIPFWMMQNLLIEEGSLITVMNVSLPKATFVKLQPQSVDFLEISNPRAVLEHALRNYSCVTLGDIIQIPYNSKNYHFELKDVQPARAACIIETDCQVDFDAPVGYQEPTPSASQRSSACPSPATTQSAASSSMMDNASINASAGGGPDGSKPAGVRIVDGKIVRPDDYHDKQKQQQHPLDTTMLAERVGGTGVQINAATLPQSAPAVDYWAVCAGDGARLDGKAAPVLKDATGQELDVRRLRAEAAANRRAAEAAAKASSSSTLSSGGQTLSGAPAGAETLSELPPKATAPVSMRKSRVGDKFSRLKQSGVAFQGSANTFDNSTNHNNK